MTAIFVFGSNTEGRHGKGAALTARRQYGAIYGQAYGRQGNAYAIVTKSLRRIDIPIDVDYVAKQVDIFIRYACAHPELSFYVTPIGCGLAGFTAAQIAPLFAKAPSNCHLPPTFLRVLADE